MSTAKSKTTKERFVVIVGKKKKATARARVRTGKGTIRINSIPLEKWGSIYDRTIISEPLMFIQDTIKDLDIDAWASGGGRMGQALAARTAIARGIVEFTRNADIRKTLISYDNKILSGDARQREPCKPNRSAPRAVRQKSYR